MSLFLGVSNDGNKQLHITKGLTDLGTIKGPPIATTIFHSNLNYLTVTKHLASISNSILTVDPALKVIMESSVYIIVTASGVFIPPLYTNIANYVRGIFYTYGIWSGNSMNLKGADTGPCSVYVFNCTLSSFMPVTKTGNDIEVGNKKLLVNGVNLVSQAYVSRGILNDVDPIISIQGKAFQLTNLNFSALDSLSVVSNSSSTYIARGDKKIIDSALGYCMEYIQTGQAYIPATSGLGFNYNTVTYFTPFGRTVTNEAFIAINMRSSTVYGDNGYGTAILPVGIGEIEVVVSEISTTYNRFEHRIYISVSTTGITVRSYLQSFSDFVGYYAYYHLFGV